MSALLHVSRKSIPTSSRSYVNLTQTRAKSSSPYGRSHLRETPTLPNAMVPHFRQRVILSDGSTFTHFTTSPRSVIRVTRDLTNNPFWQPALDGISAEDEDSGRLGRFKRKFGRDADGGRIELGDLPVSETQSSNALLVAAKNNVGARLKGQKADDGGKGAKGRKK